MPVQIDIKKKIYTVPLKDWAVLKNEPRYQGGTVTISGDTVIIEVAV